jgi:hypothetical protein
MIINWILATIVCLFVTITVNAILSLRNESYKEQKDCDIAMTALSAGLVTFYSFSYLQGFDFAWEPFHLYVGTAVGYLLRKRLNDEKN